MMVIALPHLSTSGLFTLLLLLLLPLSQELNRLIAPWMKPVTEHTSLNVVGSNPLIHFQVSVIFSRTFFFSTLVLTACFSVFLLLLLLLFLSLTSSLTRTTRARLYSLLTC